MLRRDQMYNWGCAGETSVNGVATYCVVRTRDQIVGGVHTRTVSSSCYRWCADETSVGQVSRWCPHENSVVVRRREQCMQRCHYYDHAPRWCAGETDTNLIIFLCSFIWLTSEFFIKNLHYKSQNGKETEIRMHEWY